MTRRSTRSFAERVVLRAGSPQISITLPGFGRAVGRPSDRVRIASRTHDPAVFERRRVLLRTLFDGGYERLIDALLANRLQWRDLERAHASGAGALRDLLQTTSTPAWSLAVDEFLKSYRRRNIAAVERHIRAFGVATAAHLGRPVTVADCTTANVTWWLSSASRVDGREGTLASSTLNRMRAHLSAFARWAVQREYLTRHPIAWGQVRAHPEPAPRMPVLSVEAVRRYLAAARAADTEPVQRRSIVLALCALTGGDVASEVLRMRPSDLHGPADGALASILYRREKTRTRERLVPLSDAATLHALRALVAATPPGADTIFGDLTLWQVWTVHRHARKAIGATLSIKDLRHIAAQLFRRAGADLQQVRDWMGHASLTQTQIYAAFGPDEAMDTPVARRLQQLIGGEG